MALSFSDLIFCDSFDHYDMDSIGDKWPGTSGTGKSLTTGRTGTGVHLTNALQPLVKQVKGASVYGFAKKGYIRIRFYNVDGVEVASIADSGDGRIAATVRSVYPLAWSINEPAMHTYEWYYVEYGVQAADTSVSIVASVNGNQVMSRVKVDLPEIEPGIEVININGPGGGFDSYIDDFYCKGGGFTAMYGDVRISAVYPTSDYHPLEWTCSDDSAIHYLMINKPKALSGDASDDILNINSEVPGQVDQHNFNTMPDTKHLFALQGVFHATSDATAWMNGVWYETEDSPNDDFLVTAPFYTFYTDCKISPDPFWGDLDPLEIAVKAKQITFGPKRLADVIEEPLP